MVLVAAIYAPAAPRPLHTASSAAHGESSHRCGVARRLNRATAPAARRRASARAPWTLGAWTLPGQAAPPSRHRPPRRETAARSSTRGNPDVSGSQRIPVLPRVHTALVPLVREQRQMPPPRRLSIVSASSLLMPHRTQSVRGQCHWCARRRVEEVRRVLAVPPIAHRAADGLRRRRELHAERASTRQARVISPDGPPPRQRRRPALMRRAAAAPRARGARMASWWCTGVARRAWERAGVQPPESATLSGGGGNLRAPQVLPNEWPRVAGWRRRAPPSSARAARPAARPAAALRVACVRSALTRPPRHALSRQPWSPTSRRRRSRRRRRRRRTRRTRRQCSTRRSRSRRTRR